MGVKRMNTKEKNPPAGGLRQFKPVSFKCQLYIEVYTKGASITEKRGIYCRERGGSGKATRGLSKIFKNK